MVKNPIYVDKCLKALAEVLFWDIRTCPFCGKGPKEYDTSPNHDSQCVVLIADELMNQ